VVSPPEEDQKEEILFQREESKVVFEDEATPVFEYDSPEKSIREEMPIQLTEPRVSRSG
jgi:hypothetical protein